jgi:hypothetical protein
LSIDVTTRRPLATLLWLALRLLSVVRKLESAERAELFVLMLVI